MRVLMVTHTHPLFEGDGTAPFIDSIARGLMERGHCIDVVLPEHPNLRFRGMAQNGITYHPYRYSPSLTWAPWGYGNAVGGDSSMRPSVLALMPGVAVSLRRRLAGLLARHEYDLIHAHWAIPNGWLCAHPARRHALPLVVSLHGSDVSLPERRALLRPAVHRAFAAASAISACSADLARRAERIGARPERVRTIPYGVDAAEFAPRRPNPLMRAKLMGESTGGDSALIVAVGRLVEFKGFRYLIEAASRVTGVRVAIVGSGSLRAELQQLAQELDAPVNFVGALPRAEVAAALAEADIVVAPSIVDDAGRVDGLPNTVLEALAAGRPLIAGAVGGIPEVVKDGRNGLLVAPRDPGALAAAIERLRSSETERAQLGQEARMTALDRLTWDRTAALFEELYALATNDQGLDPR